MSAGRPRVVVQLLGTLETGGAEMRALDMVKALHGAPVRFHFVALSGHVGALAGEFESWGATVTPMKIGPFFPVRFVRYLRAVGADAVHSHIALTSGVMMMLAYWAGSSTRIAHFHSDGDGRGNSACRRLYRWCVRALVRRYATHIIGVSPSALSRGYRADWRADPRARLVPNGVDTERFSPRAEHRAGDVLRIVAVGRSSPEKNLQRMPAVLAAYIAAMGPAELRIVGPRDERVDGEVLAVARAKHVPGQVALLPAMSDVRPVLERSDVLLLTSFREGLPSVVLEAAAMGIPVVSSTVGGSQWIAEFFPWVHCLDLAEGDDVWARTLELAKATAPDRARTELTMAESPFTMEKNVEAVLTIYGAEPLSVAEGGGAS